MNLYLTQVNHQWKKKTNKTKSKWCKNGEIVSKNYFLHGPGLCIVIKLVSTYVHTFQQPNLSLLTKLICPIFIILLSQSFLISVNLLVFLIFFLSLSSIANEIAVISHSFSHKFSQTGSLCMIIYILFLNYFFYVRSFSVFWLIFFSTYFDINRM